MIFAILVKRRIPFGDVAEDSGLVQYDAVSLKECFVVS
jgi:hypothetical protein